MPDARAPIASEEVRRIFAAHPDAIQSFGGPEALEQTINSINAVDTQFHANNGTFMQRGSNPFETARNFTEVNVNQYRDVARPSLPALAMHYADRLQIPSNSPGYKAMMMVAVRAEMAQAANPAYHSKNHYVDVATMTSIFIEKNDAMVKMEDPRAVPLTKAEKAELFTAAIGHDLDHEGKGNPKDNIYFNEEGSFQKLKPILEASGMSAESIEKIHIKILTTSPNGPHAVLKAVAKAQREGQEVDWNKIDPEGKFAALKDLATDPELTQRSAMLSDADLFASSGAGVEANVKMSKLLTTEVQASGVNINFNTDAAQKFFQDNIVGREGFASNAGREVANASFETLSTLTSHKVDIDKGFKALETATDQTISDLETKTAEKFAALEASLSKPAESPETKLNTDTPHPTLSRGVSAAQIGASGYGLAIASQHLYEAYKKDDKLGMFASGGDVAASGLDVGLDIARAVGANIAPALQQVAGRVNMGMMAADMAVQVYNEEGGAVNKTERAIAGVTNFAAASVAGGAAATAVTALAVGGVAAVAAPVVAGAAAAYVMKKSTDNIVTAERTARDTIQHYQKHDAEMKETFAAGKRTTTPETEKPSVYDYKNLGSIPSVLHNIRADHLKGPVPDRDSSGGVRTLRGVDMTNPENLRELERAIKIQSQNAQQTLEDNSSMLPRWVRSGDSLAKYNNAEIELTQLSSARQELGMFKKETAGYNETIAAQASVHTPAKNSGDDWMNEGKIKSDIKLTASFNQHAPGHAPTPSHNPAPHTPGIDGAQIQNPSVQQFKI